MLQITSCVHHFLHQNHLDQNLPWFFMISFTVHTDTILPILYVFKNTKVEDPYEIQQPCLLLDCQMKLCIRPGRVEKIFLVWIQVRFWVLRRYDFFKPGSSSTTWLSFQQDVFNFSGIFSCKFSQSKIILPNQTCTVVVVIFLATLV